MIEVKSDLRRVEILGLIYAAYWDPDYFETVVHDAFSFRGA